MIMATSANRKKFEELIDQWILIEDKSIDNTNDLMSKSDNPIVKSMIDLIKMDSEKHKRILETIRLSLNSTVVFNTDDLMVVDSLVEKHAQMEEHAVETAEQAVEMSSLPIPKFLLEHLLQDERSHDAYVQELDELRVYMSKDT